MPTRLTHMNKTGHTSVDDGAFKPSDGNQVADVVAQRVERLIMDGILKVGDALLRSDGCVRGSASHARRCAKGCKYCVHWESSKPGMARARTSPAYRGRVEPAHSCIFSNRSRARCTICLRCEPYWRARRHAWRRFEPHPLISLWCGDDTKRCMKSRVRRLM